MNKGKTSFNMKMFTRDANFVRLFIVFIAVFIACCALKGSQFLNAGNFESMVKQFPEYGLLAVAIGLALLIGGIDLSAVYIANLSSIIAGRFLIAIAGEGASEGTVYAMIFASFLVAVVIGILAGALNGYLISGFGIPAIVAPLGTQFVLGLWRGTYRRFEHERLPDAAGFGCKRFYRFYTGYGCYIYRCLRGCGTDRIPYGSGTTDEDVRYKQ